MFSSARLDYPSYLRAEDVCVYMYVLIYFNLICNCYADQTLDVKIHPTAQIIPWTWIQSVIKNQLRIQTRTPVHLYCTIALHFETVLLGILNVLVPFPALGQRKTIYSSTMREPTSSLLNENAKDNSPPPPTYNGPKPHPFSQQTLRSIYKRVPELQSSLIFLIKDQQYQIAPHFLVP